MTRSRVVLVTLMLWGLAMLVPDLLRVAQPLGSFGFYANNDGLIYDVAGPFDEEGESPAWKAGIRPGDRLDLTRLRCSLADVATCGYAIFLRADRDQMVEIENPLKYDYTVINDNAPFGFTVIYRGPNNGRAYLGIDDLLDAWLY